MERREGNERTFPNVYSISRMSYPTYRPILPPTHRVSSTPSYHCQLLQKSRSHVRHVCACFSVFNCVLLLCLSPLPWVQFTVLQDRQKLLVGLWTVCHHELCWSHTPKAPYYLQYSRAFFLISASSTLIVIIWLSISLAKGPGDKTYIDLGMSIFCFISGTFLLFCLILFLMQAKLYSRNALEPHFLLVYRINWWGSVFYMIAGFLSGLNHISSQVSLPDQNLLLIPITRTRVGNAAAVELSLSEANVGVSPRVSQTPEKQLSSVAQPRTQAEAETETEPETQTGPEIRSESVKWDSLITQARLGTEVESVDTAEPRPEAGKTVGIVNTSSSRLDVNEKKMSEDRGDEDRFT